VESSVEVTIYDIQGRIVKSFTYNTQSAGYQSVVWDGTNSRGSMMSSGIYICRVKASSIGSGIIFDKTAKMLLQK
jgi:flagellar hook assembly protein FlgD